MNKIPNNIKCVICRKDISDELPKVDVYENYYCKSCYEKKCAIEVYTEKVKRQTAKEILTDLYRREEMGFDVIKWYAKSHYGIEVDE